MQLGKGLKATVDRGVTEPPRRTNGTDRHIAEHIRCVN